MNREIKFRVWYQNKMHYNCIVGNGQVLFIPDAIGEYKWISIAECIVMRFTGKIDKNGKEIYESDIIPFDFSIDKINAHYFKGVGVINGFIEWHILQCRFHIKYPESKKHNLVSTDLGWGNQNYLEIIGNIHETPELL